VFNLLSLLGHEFGSPIALGAVPLRCSVGSSARLTSGNHGGSSQALTAVSTGFNSRMGIAYGIAIAGYRFRMAWDGEKISRQGYPDVTWPES
jgi:hypothetical protein